MPPNNITYFSVVRYDSQRGKGKNSGAYLFMPSGPAEPFNPEPFPQIVVIEGIYKTTIYTALTSPDVAEVTAAVSYCLSFLTYSVVSTKSD